MRLTTEKEKIEMHLLLDTCIDKMNNDKNRYKPHWNTLTLKELQLMLTVENAELDLAMFSGNREEINSELKDVINLAMFAMHNILKVN